MCESREGMKEDRGKLAKNESVKSGGEGGGGSPGKIEDMSQGRLVTEGGCVRKKWANLDVGRQLKTRIRKRN